MTYPENDPSQNPGQPSSQDPWAAPPAGSSPYGDAAPAGPYEAPSSPYAAPQEPYGGQAPTQGYGAGSAPEQGYGAGSAPEHGYGAGQGPAQGPGLADPYGAPTTGAGPYGAPAPGAGPYGAPVPGNGAYSAPGQGPAGAQPGVPAGGLGPSRLTTGLLGIFLGGWGVHRFLLGYTGIGIAQIAVTICTCGIGAIWGLIEGILILTRSPTFEKDAHGRPLAE